MKAFARFLVVTAVLLGCIVQARAQVNGRRVDGIVSDPQGLPLPGVKVVLTESQTDVVRTFETSNPYFASRSKIRNLGTDPNGNASRNCWTTQGLVGRPVTLKCRMRRRSWLMTKKQ